MIAIEIRINGELKATCGVADLSQLVAMVAARRPADSSSSGASAFDVEVECLGLRPKDPDTNEVLKWVTAKINFGDDVSIKFIETDRAQEPRLRQDISAHGPDS